MRPAVFLIAAFAFTIAPAGAATDTQHLPEGATIAGVPVGGLGPYGARGEVQTQLRPTAGPRLGRRRTARPAGVPTPVPGKRGDTLRRAEAEPGGRPADRRS